MWGRAVVKAAWNDAAWRPFAFRAQYTAHRLWKSNPIVQPYFSKTPSLAQTHAGVPPLRTTWPPYQRHGQSKTPAMAAGAAAPRRCLKQLRRSAPFAVCATKLRQPQPQLHHSCTPAASQMQRDGAHGAREGVAQLLTHQVALLLRGDGHAAEALRLQQPHQPRKQRARALLHKQLVQ